MIKIKILTFANVWDSLIIVLFICFIMIKIIIILAFWQLYYYYFTFVTNWIECKEDNR